MRRLLTILGACLMLGVLAAPPAGAATAAQVLNDCQLNDRLTHRYDVAVLQRALKEIGGVSAEYGDCYDVISRALLAEGGKLNGGSSGSGGSFLPTWVIVVVVVLVIGGAGFGILAVRRRQPGGDDAAGPPGPPLA